MSIKSLQLAHVLFLDIETVPEYEFFDDLSEEAQALWEAKTAYKRKDEITAEAYYPHAGIWAEFGKIVCISVGYFNPNKEKEFRITSFYGEEVGLLMAFKSLVNRHFNQPQHLFCAHNGKEFDFPYIARRMLINQIALPEKLNLFGKKPWEIPYLDTLELWKFGDYKHYTSLRLLTHILDIPSPKDDIDGSQVYEVYYKEKKLERICRYCEKDVIALAQILLRLRQEPLLTKEQILTVEVNDRSRGGNEP